MATTIEKRDVSFPIDFANDDTDDLFNIIPDKLPKELTQLDPKTEKKLVPLLRTYEEIQKRVNGCSQALNLPTPISFERLSAALDIGNIKKYRQSEKMGDLVQQLVLNDIAIKMDCDGKFMEWVLKQTVGTNKIMADRGEKGNLKNYIFQKFDPSARKTRRVSWKRKKLYANVVEALIGAAYFQHRTKSSVDLFCAYKVMDYFKLNIQHALQIAVDGGCKLDYANVKSMAGNCLHKLENLEKQSSPEAWWLDNNTQHAGSTSATTVPSLSSSFGSNQSLGSDTLTVVASEQNSLQSCTTTLASLKTTSIASLKVLLNTPQEQIDHDNTASLRYPIAEPVRTRSRAALGDRRMSRIGFSSLRRLKRSSRVACDKVSHFFSRITAALPQT